VNKSSKTSRISLPSGYAPLLADLKARVRAAQVRAVLSVNREMVLLYWNIGREILRCQRDEGWGAKVVERLAKDLRAEFPEMHGFSRANLLSMRAFAEAYIDEAIVQQLVGQLPWGHNILLLAKVKNAEHGSANANARYRKKFTAADVAASAMVADPLRLMDVCATSDGGAALVISSLAYAKRIGKAGAPRIAAISTVTPTFPSAIVEMPDLANDSAVTGAPQAFRAALPRRAYEEAGIGPKDVSLAEVYDLSTALELDWIEDLQLCERGRAAALTREGATRIGGRIPVNPSGGLACFGEAVPAQALAQVCELTWQLRGQAGERQVQGARVGITANQGLFGHGSSVIVRCA